MPPTGGPGGRLRLSTTCTDGQAWGPWDDAYGPVQPRDVHTQCEAGLDSSAE